MLSLLKIIHFACLFGGGAAGIGNGLLLRRVMASGKPPDSVVAATMKTLGVLGLVSVVLLWLTGIWMVAILDKPIDWLFAIKLAGAAVVLLASAGLNLTAARAGAAGKPPDGNRMRMLGNLASMGAIVAVVFAVLAFR